MNPDSVRLVVDPDRCVGVGRCEMLEPDVMEIDDDTAISAMLPDSSITRERAEKLVAECPSSAISIEEAP